MSEFTDYEKVLIKNFIKNLNPFLKQFTEEFNKVGVCVHGEAIQEESVGVLIFCALETINIPKEIKVKILEKVKEKL